LSTFASTALERGFATQENLDEMSRAWKFWGAQPDAWFSLLHGEILRRKAEVVLGLVIRVLKKVCFEYVIDATCLPQSRSKDELGLQYHRASSLISELEARNPHKCS
jgi:hypothetical protein